MPVLSGVIEFLILGGIFRWLYREKNDFMFLIRWEMGYLTVENDDDAREIRKRIDEMGIGWARAAWFMCGAKQPRI